MFQSRLIKITALCFAALPSWAATFTVSSTADVVDATPGDGICETAAGNGICTLRAAIQEAGALPGANTIIVPAGTYFLSATPACLYKLAGDPAVLTQNMSALCVRGTVTISGAGSNATIIDAGGAGGATCCGDYPAARGMVISADSVASISGVTVQNGLSNGGPGPSFLVEGASTIRAN
jgi:CSLREA domain-containing protein